MNVQEHKIFASDSQHNFSFNNAVLINVSAPNIMPHVSSAAAGVVPTEKGETLIRNWEQNTSDLEGPN
jgi:hypothetical protein